MHRNQTNSHHDRPTSSGEQVVSALVDVMVDLAELLRAENALLSRGMPAALCELTPRKVELSDEYADLLVVANRRHAAEIAGDPALCRRLAEMADELDAAAKENKSRLEAAMAATRRRIDAVMSAVLKHEAMGRGYGGNGASVLRPLISCHTGYRA
jgi:hypothetical protein